MNDFTNNYQQTLPLSINDKVREQLYPALKWAKFLAILGFIGTGLMALGGIIMLIGSFTNTSPYATTGSLMGLGILYLVMAVIYFFMSRYLHRFATKTHDALTVNNQLSLEEGFGALRRYYTISGIMVIVMLCLVVIAIVAAIITGVMQAF